MSEPKLSGRIIVIWSGEPTEEYFRWLPKSHEVRRGLEVCERCKRTVDCLLVGIVEDRNVRETLDEIRDRFAKENCEDHHLPPMRQ